MATKETTGARSMLPTDHLIRIGQACVDWVTDTGDCLFCDYRRVGHHEEWCVLATPAATPEKAPVRFGPAPDHDPQDVPSHMEDFGFEPGDL